MPRTAFLLAALICQLITTLTAADVVTTIAGSSTAGYLGDGGQASAALFSSPGGVACDDTGNVYVADTSNHVIRKISTTGIVNTYCGTGVAGSPTSTGPATACQLTTPMALSWDSATGTLLAADADTNTVICIQNGQVTTILSAGGAPSGVAMDTKGNIYISGRTTNTVTKIAVGTHNTTTILRATAVNAPRDLVLDPVSKNYLFITNSGTGEILKYGPLDAVAYNVPGVGLVGGPTTSTYTIIGTGSLVAITAASDGTLYGSFVGKGLIYNAFLDGVDSISSTTYGGQAPVTRFAGTYPPGYGGDGGPALQAQFSSPTGIAVDGAGNILVADAHNNVVRKIISTPAITNDQANGQVGKPLTYQITASHAPTSYAATNLPAGLRLNPTTGVISGTPTSAGTPSVQISATNIAGTGTGTVVLNIWPPVPVITSPATVAALINTAFSYTITGSDQPTSFGATGLPTGLSLDPTTGIISGAVGVVGTTTIQVTATNKGGTGTASVAITFSQTPPAITSATSISTHINTGFTYTITGTNQPSSFAATGLPQGLSLSPFNNGVISGTPTVLGTFPVTVSATNQGGTGTATVTIVVTPQPPFITSAGSATGTMGLPFTFTVTGTNSPTTFTVTSGLPPGLLLNPSTGMITGTPTSTGSFQATITVGNAGGQTTGTLAITVLPQPPVITSSATATAIANTAFTYTITGTNSPTSFSVVQPPTGMDYNNQTGVISGKAAFVGSYTIQLSATNAGGTGTATLTLTVIPEPPDITSDLATAQVGVPYSRSVTGSNAPTTFGAAPLPPGLTISTSTGVISGTPTTAGTYMVTLSATNSTGTGSVTMPLVVLPQAPVFTAQGPVVGHIGVPFSFQVTASNNPTGYAGTNLPGGLSMSATTGLISGTPTAAEWKTVYLTATNTGGTGSGTQVINILPLPPVITSATTAAGVVGVPFTYTITASSSISTYTATGLPPGLTLDNQSGVISGTPRSATTSMVTIGATMMEPSAPVQLTITIRNPVPAITSPATMVAFVGQAFTYAITASNQPTSFSAVGLPSGLSVDTATGRISGTPTTAGTANATITATNESGTATQTVRVTVNAPLAPIITNTPLTGESAPRWTTGATVAYTITASNAPTAFGAVGLPPGTTLDTATGVITGQPTAVGTYQVTITATNPIGTDTKTLSVRVTLPPPTVTSPLTGTGQVGTPFSYTFTTTNGPASFVLTGLPAGLSMPPSTSATASAVSPGTPPSTISGTPTTAGTYPVTVEAFNEGGSTTTTLTITVNPAPVSTTPPPAAVGGGGGGGGGGCGLGSTIGLLLFGALSQVRRRRPA